MKNKKLKKISNSSSESESSCLEEEYKIPKKKLSNISSDSESNSSSEEEYKTISKKKTYNWTKKNKFKEQRMNILKKINKILGVTKTNIKIDLNDLSDNDIKKIVDMYNDIGIYFSGKHISIFSKDRCENVKRAYLSLIKLVYKEMGWLFQRILKQKNGKQLSYYIVIDIND